MRQGTRFLGSDEIKTSVANEELVPQGKYFYKFSFVNENDCTVIINNEEPIFLKEGFGFSTNEVDPNISSFVIVESGIEFFWIGGE